MRFTLVLCCLSGGFPLLLDWSQRLGWRQDLHVSGFLHMRKLSNRKLHVRGSQASQQVGPPGGREIN